MFRILSSRLAISSATFYTQPNLSSLSGQLPAKFGPDSSHHSPLSSSSSSASHSSSHGASSASSGSSFSSSVVIDHLVIDASGLTSAALRLLKNEPQIEREAARIVVQQTSSLARRVQPRRSLVLLMDGSEGIWKAAKTRGKGSSKKAEERAARGPGSSLALAVETALLNSLADRRFAPVEVVVSGSCVPGSIETKAAQWAAGVARRPRTLGDLAEAAASSEHKMSHKQQMSSSSSPSSSSSSTTPIFAAQTDTVAYVGPNEFYFHLLTCPFSSSGSVAISQGTTDYKCIQKKNLVDWLGFGRAMSKSSVQLFAMMMMSSGSSPSSLSSSGGGGGGGTAAGDFFQHKRNFPDEVPPPSASNNFAQLTSLNGADVRHRMVQDMAFLMLLAQGHGGYELLGVPQLAPTANFADLLDSYWKVVTTEIKPAAVRDADQATTKSESDRNGIDGDAADSDDAYSSLDRSSNGNSSSSGSVGGANAVSSLPDLYKNEHWLLERDSSPPSSKRAAETIFSRLAARRVQSNSNMGINLASCPPDETYEHVAPQRFGINVQVLTLILKDKHGGGGGANAVAAASRGSQIPVPAQLTQVSTCDGLWPIFASSALPSKLATADTAAYLDSVLQIFHLLTLGKAALPGFYLPHGFVPPSANNILEYLRVLSRQSAPAPATLFPVSADDVAVSAACPASLREMHTAPLTSAEYALLSAGSARHFAELANQFVGQPVSESFANKVAVATKSVPEALTLVRKLLKYGNASNPHRGLCHSPSVCLVEVPGKSPEVEQLMQIELAKEEQERKKFEEFQQQQQKEKEAASLSVATSTSAQPLPASSSSSSAYSAIPVGGVMGARMALQPQKKGVGQKFALMRSHWRMFPVELGS